MKQGSEKEVIARRIIEEKKRLLAERVQRVKYIQQNEAKKQEQKLKELEKRKLELEKWRLARGFRPKPALKPILTKNLPKDKPKPSDHKVSASYTLPQDQSCPPLDELNKPLSETTQPDSAHSLNQSCINDTQAGSTPVISKSSEKSVLNPEESEKALSHSQSSEKVFISPDESEEDVELTEPESDPYLASSPNTIIYNSEKGNDSPVTPFFLTAKEYCKNEKEYSPYKPKLDDVFEDDSSYDSIDKIKESSRHSDSIESLPEEEKEDIEEIYSESDIISISPSKRSSEISTPKVTSSDIKIDSNQKPEKILTSSIYFDFEIRMQEIEKERQARDKSKERAKAVIKQRILSAIKPERLISYETPVSESPQISLPTFPEEFKSEFMGTARFNTAEEIEETELQPEEDVSLVNFASYKRIQDTSSESIPKPIVISDIPDENIQIKRKELIARMAQRHPNRNSSICEIPRSSDATPIQSPNRRDRNLSFENPTKGDASMLEKYKRHKNLPDIKYTKPSNRQIIRNAISQVCLAGEPYKRAREEVLKAIDNNPEVSYFIILFKGTLGRKDLKALYSHNIETGQLNKLHGSDSAPSEIHGYNISSYFRYDSGNKEFRQLQCKTLITGVDGITIKNM